MEVDVHSQVGFAHLARRVTEFWGLVDSSGGVDICWPWTGYLNKDGYGEYHWLGRMVGAHELAVTFTTGEVRAPGLDTCHECDTPGCCNPRHLRFDTRLGNVADAVSRGRHARGETAGAARLTEADVLMIRERAHRGGTGRSLASEYGLSESAITEIIRGRRWPHVGGPIRIGHGNSKNTQWLTPPEGD